MSTYVKYLATGIGGGGGGNIFGSGAANQVAVFSGTNTIGGSSALTFNGTTLSLTGGFTASGTITLTGLTASKVVTTDSSQRLDVLGYGSAAVGNTLVQRDGSGNFSAGTITAALTGIASGNTTYTPNNHGLVLSGAANAMTVIAPDASTIKVLVSGGSSADPVWGTVAAGAMPALTGDVTSSAGSTATTIAKIQSVTVSGVTGTGNAVLSISPTFTGTLTAPSGSITSSAWDTGTSSLTVNGVAFSAKAPLASPTFTGTVTLPSGSVTSSAWTYGASTFGGSGIATFTGQLIGKGTATNDDPAAGYIGQVITATATGVSYANANNYNDVATVPLTAGDWLVSGAVATQNGTAVAPLDSYAAIGTASGTNATGQVAGDTEFANGPPDANNERTTTIPSRRYSLSGSQTLYLKGRCNRTSGTPTGSGRITAVRIR